MAYKDKSSAIKYNNEFIKQAYDRINLTVPKGEKDAIAAAAKRRDESVNAYIYNAVRERMGRDAQGGGGGFHSLTKGDQDSGE